MVIGTYFFEDLGLIYILYLALFGRNLCIAKDDSDVLLYCMLDMYYSPPNVSPDNFCKLK